jgi:hypothetical protein
MLLIAGVGAAFALPALEEASPTAKVTFTGSGLGVLICGSHPTPSGINIRSGTRVNLINNTGDQVSLEIAPGGDHATLADGDGLIVRFRNGQHTVRMIPQCLLGALGEAKPAVIVVTPDAPPPSTGPPQLGPPGPSASSRPPVPGKTTPGPDGSDGIPAPVTTPTSFGGDLVPARPGTVRTVSLASISDAPASPPEKSTPRSTDDISLSAGKDIYPEVLPYGLGPSDDQGRTLLAVIAAICVLGVTAAIIRAILAQRASGIIRT